MLFFMKIFGLSGSLPILDKICSFHISWSGFFCTSTVLCF